MKLQRNIQYRSVAILEYRNSEIIKNCESEINFANVCQHV